jgi:macrolide transport system ATP-binding/permease protein
MDRPIISALDASKSYKIGRNEVSALKKFDLDIFKGEFVIVYGPSGSGKTTLLSLLAGLELPTSGKIMIEGTDINALPPGDQAKYRGKKIGMVFQQFNLIEAINSRDNVAMPLLLQGGNSRKSRIKASQYLSILGLKDRAKHKPSQLSGGQQQRVAIARSLVSGPDILLVDEPTGNLDVPTGKEIMGILKEINQKWKTTIVMVTHNPEFVNDGSRILHMEDGKIIKEVRNRQEDHDAGELGEELGKERKRQYGSLRLLETLRLSSIHFISKGLRAFLTTLGVAMGVGSIVALVSLGIGLQNITANQLASLDMLVSIGVSSNKDSSIKLDDNEIAKIASIDDVVLVSPTISVPSKISISGSTSEVMLQGLKPSALDYENVNLQSGKEYSDDSGIIISRATAKLFGDSEPGSYVGKDATLSLILAGSDSNDLTQAKIINVNEKIVGVSSDESAPSAFISLSRIKKITSAASYNSLKVKVDDRKNVAQVKTAIEALGFSTNSVVDLIDRVDKVFLITQIALGIIGGVALIIALIGIINIMTVALLERTHEVGVLKAIGASSLDIRRVFEYEVLMYGLAGAIFGVLGAWGLGELINHTIGYLMKVSDIPGSIRLFETPFSFAIEMVVLTVFASLLGGWYPSKKASKLSPMEALRYE